MLVLLSFGLVLVATVLLVLGLVSDSGGLTLIYLSIAASAVAGVLLIVSYTKIGKKPAASTAAGGSPERDEAATPAPAATATTAAVTAPATPAPVVDESAFAPEPNPATAATGVVPEPVEEEGEEEFFPIADYDSLTVAQIVPLLPELYADELDVVEERERSGKNRAQILDRLAELREQLRGAPADATGSSVASSNTSEVPAVGQADPVAAEAGSAQEAMAAAEEDEPVPAKKAAGRKAAAKKATTGAKKAPAKKAATTKKAAAATKATSTRKAATKKAAATTAKAAAPVKKATKKAAGTAEKAAPAKKATATKKATKATKATKKA